MSRPRGCAGKAPCTSCSLRSCQTHAAIFVPIDGVARKRFVTRKLETAVPEEIAGVCCPFVLGPANQFRRLAKRPIGKERKEVDRIEQVRFSGGVQADDARERTERDINLSKVLETVDLQTRQHDVTVPEASI